jgi:hypothetical protein
LSSIDPEETFGMKSEILSLLPKNLKKFTKLSANQWIISKRIISELTRYDPKMAINFAREINTQYRRDKAILRILQVYLDQEEQNFDIEFAFKITKNIYRNQPSEWSLIYILEKINNEDIYTKFPDKRQYIKDTIVSEIDDFASQRRQCLAYALSFSIFDNAKDNISADSQYEKMINALSLIDEGWRQVEIGFDLAATIGQSNNEKSQDLIKLSRERQSGSSLAIKSHFDIYVDIVSLSIRIFPDIIKKSDYKFEREKLLKSIEIIPSIGTQCRLISDLALQHHFSDCEKDFNKLVKNKIIPKLEIISDSGAYIQTIIYVAPSIYHYERELLKEKIDILQPHQKDSALGEILKYLLSKRLPSDPVRNVSMILDN